jgi:hypothetical protein
MRLGGDACGLRLVEGRHGGGGAGGGQVGQGWSLSTQSEALLPCQAVAIRGSS